MNVDDRRPSLTSHELALLLLAVAAIALGCYARLAMLSYPNHESFDEAHYPRAAEILVERQPYGNIYHPPFGIMLMATGILLLGKTPFGWRFPSAMAGLLTIVLVSVAAHQVTRSRVTALLVACMIAMDGLFITFSRTALLDSFLVPLIFAAVVLSDRVRRSTAFVFAVGTLVGLAMATKWSGLFVLAPIAWIAWRRGWTRWVPLLAMWAFLIYAALVVFNEILQKSPHPIQSAWAWQIETWHYHHHLTEGHFYASRWYQWPFMLVPVLFDKGEQEGLFCTIMSLANPFLLYSSTLAVGGTLGFAPLQLHEPTFRKQFRESFFPILVGYAAFFLPWAVISRPGFFYYYLPAYGFALILIAILLTHLWENIGWGKYAVLCFLSVASACTVYLLPLNVGTPLTDAEFRSRMWLSSWDDPSRFHDMGTLPIIIDFGAPNVESWSDPEAAPQIQDLAEFGSLWTNNNHVFFPFTREGQSARFSFESAEACVANIDLYATSASDYGVISIRLSGAKRHATTADLYSSQGIGQQILRFSHVALRAGKNELEVRITGKNASSGGYQAGFDRLEFRCERP